MDETSTLSFCITGKIRYRGGGTHGKKRNMSPGSRSFNPIMEENNYELVDVEYVKEAGTWYLRAYIDKEGGFTVDDCEMVSRRLSDWLDKRGLYR